MVSDPPESSCPHFHLHPQVDVIIQGTCDHADSLARHTKLLSSILPKKRHRHSVTDEPESASPQVFNPNFSWLAENKSISNRCMSSVTFFELERMEGCTKALLDVNSFSLWFMPGLLSQLKRMVSSPLIPRFSTLRFCLSPAPSPIKCRWRPS